MQLFFTNNTEDQFILSKEESNHISKVLRKKEGDAVYFTNGQGLLLIAEIISSNNQKTKVKVTSRIEKEKEHNYNLHIAIAPTKNIERFEWFLEKTTEIGIDEITPIICDRSERKIIKNERCNRILLSAIKQSLKYHMPKLNESISFNEFIKQDIQGSKYIAHCEDVKKIELRNEKTKNQITILIGPEGDFSPSEIKTAIQRSFTPINLNNSRLRTETAAIIAAHTINIIN